MPIENASFVSVTNWPLRTCDGNPANPLASIQFELENNVRESVSSNRDIFTSGTISMRKPALRDGKDTYKWVTTSKEFPWRHITAEVPMETKEYFQFETMRMIWWWTHHGLSVPMMKDITAENIIGNFREFYNQYKKVTWKMTREITNPNGEFYKSRQIHVLDPHFFSSIAKNVKSILPNPPKFIAHSYINFPSPKDFSILFCNLTKTAEGKKFRPLIKSVIKAYLIDWLNFDAIIFLSNSDLDNFKKSIEYFIGPNVLENLGILLKVSPLGVNIEKIEDITKANFTEDKVAQLSDLIINSAGKSSNNRNFGIKNLSDLEGQSIIFDIGTRSDPIKFIPQKLKAIQLMLNEHPELIGKVSLIQQVRPHRQQLYSHISELKKIQKLVSQINKQYSRENWQPIILIDQEILHEDVLCLDRLITGLAARSASILVSHEGMGRAPQEAIFSATGSKVGLILSLSNGLGEYLNKINPFNVKNPMDITETASVIYSFLNYPIEQIEQTYEKCKEMLQNIRDQVRMKEIEQQISVTL